MKNNPDTDRWYLGYSLLAGGVLSGSESASLSQSIPIMLVLAVSIETTVRCTSSIRVNALNCLLDASEQFSDSPPWNLGFPSFQCIDLHLGC